MNAYKRELSASDQFRNIAELIALNVSIVSWLILGPSVLPLYAFLPISIILILFHQRMMSEWMHEASHWNILKWRKANDLAANTLIFPFLGVTTELNRTHHFKHHNNTHFFVAGDPDTESHIVETKKQFWHHVFSSLMGKAAFKMFFTWLRIGQKTDQKKNSQALKYIALGITHSVLFAYSIQTGYWYIYPFYFGVLITIYPIFQTFRAWGQHACVRSDGTAFLTNSTISRSMYGGLVEKLFFNSAVMAYHYEHHKWPGLPFRQLSRIAERHDDVNINGTGCLPIISSVWNGLK